MNPVIKSRPSRLVEQIEYQTFKANIAGMCCVLRMSKPGARCPVIIVRVPGGREHSYLGFNLSEVEREIEFLYQPEVA